MAVTDTHVAVLYTMLTGREDEYDRGVTELHRTGDYDGYLTLLLHAFHDAVVRRFSLGSTWRPSDVTEYVATMRSQMAKDDIRLHPTVAEQLIRAELGDGSPPALDAETMRIVLILVTHLINDEELDEDGVADVLARARTRANAQTG